MSRRRILNEYLNSTPTILDEDLEVFCQALFARDDSERYATNNLNQTLELSDKLT
jgi:hypothetical protein